MERRFEVRKAELFAECQVRSTLFQGFQQRLRTFSEPFSRLLPRSEQVEHAQTYMQGLLSDLERKNAESIAYRHDQDRRGLQNFVGGSSWDHRPLLTELARQVGTQLNEADGVLSFDPSGFVKRGHKSVGVQRQWIGRIGKVDNGQVGVYLSYASRLEHTMVDVRLYLPQEWAQDKRRRKECGVPKEIRFQTRHDLALEMLTDKGHLLPHRWITGDDEMGRSSRFRADLRERQEPYLLAVPWNILIRDLEKPWPPWSGRGRPPQRPFEQLRSWAASRAPEAWTRIDVKDGEKGPLVLEITKTRVVARTDTRRIGPEETLVVTRTQDETGSLRYDYYLSNAASDTALEEFGRVAQTHHRIEECLQRAKSETGLADYEVRTWPGWHHHQTLSLLASWFLLREAQRGKKIGTCSYRSPSTTRSGEVAPSILRLLAARTYRTGVRPPTPAHGRSTTLSLEETEPVGTITG